MFVKVTAMTAERPYAGKTAAQREQARRAALIEAGLELLGTRGTQATTVVAVCAQARLTSRYFYESFDNLDALLVAVFDHVMERALTPALEALAQSNGDIRQSITTLATAFGTALEDPRATRVALVEAWGNEALQRQRVATLHAGAAVLANTIKNGIAEPPTDGSIEVAAFAVLGGLLETMLAWVDGVLDLPREHLVDRFIDISSATMERAIATGTRSTSRTRRAGKV